MTMWSERRARKRHWCERCTRPIEPGTPYVRASLPPWADPNESDRWWSMDLHGKRLEDCPTYAPWAREVPEG